MLFNDCIPFDLSLNKDFHGANLYPIYTDRVSEYLESLSGRSSEYPIITELIQGTTIICFIWFRYASRIGWPFFYAAARAEEGNYRGDELIIADFLRTPKLAKIVRQANSFEVW